MAPRVRGMEPCNTEGPQLAPAAVASKRASVTQLCYGATRWGAKVGSMSVVVKTLNGAESE